MAVVNTVIQKFLRETQMCRSKATYDYYDQLARSLAPALDNKRFYQINQPFIDNWVWLRGEKMGSWKRLAKELHFLRQLSRWAGEEVHWKTPRTVYANSRPRQMLVPSDRDLTAIYMGATPKTRRAILLALFGGLRHSEVFRITYNAFRDHGLLQIDAEIRKTGIPNTLPLIGMLNFMFATGCQPTDRLVPGKMTDVTNELWRLSRAYNTSVPFRGLQPVRRKLVVWAEEAGHVGKVELITGHTRKSMTSRYSDTCGLIEVKREVLIDVERRFRKALTSAP